jgi:hypothetical protein
MKPFHLTFMLLCMTGILSAQNIGINTTSPRAPIHIRSAEENILTLENSNTLNVGMNTGMLFAHTLSGAASDKYTGAIKTMGTSAATARLGLFTGTTSNAQTLLERISILNNGNVGIGMIAPTYDLDVNGNSRFNGVIGIGMAPSASYGLSVSGYARYYGDLRIDGTLNPNNPLIIGNNTSIEGTLTVQNGKGIVRSTSGSQMKIKRINVSFGYTDLGPGATAYGGLLHFGEDYTSVTITAGHNVVGTGEWAKLMIVPYDVNLAEDSCQFAITNVSNSPITFSGTWQIVLVGS